MISVLRLFRQRLCSARYGGSWLVALFLLWGLGSAVPAQSVQAIPALTARVIDTSARLSVSDLQTLEERYAALERRTGSQVVALIVKTTQPEDIFSYAHRVASAWKIGRKEVGDGVLIVIASEDRRLRIEVARALEGAIPDLAAKQIIDQSLSPSLRQGNYVQALTLTADALEARISGEGLPAPTATDSASDSGGFSGLEWLMLLLVATPVVAKSALKNSNPLHFKR